MLWKDVVTWVCMYSDALSIWIALNIWLCIMVLIGKLSLSAKASIG
jgi:hypothetical protein